MVDVPKLVEQSRVVSRTKVCFRQGLEGDAEAYMKAIDKMPRNTVIGTVVHRILRSDLGIMVNIDVVREHLRGQCSCSET